MQADRVGGGVDLANAQPPGDQSQSVSFEQSARRGRQPSEPVDEFLPHRVQAGVVLARGQLLVQREPLVNVADIIGRQQRRRMQVDFGHRR